jgi:hypothetical protein
VGAWCPACADFRPFDMTALITRLGRDRRYVGRRWPIRCAEWIRGDQHGPAEREAKSYAYKAHQQLSELGATSKAVRRGGPLGESQMVANACNYKDYDTLGD